MGTAVPQFLDPFAHACDVLEFHALLERIAGRAAGPAGQAWVRELRPLPGTAGAATLQPLLADVLALAEAGVAVPQPAFRPLDDLLLRAAPEGAVLTGEELLLARAFLDAAAAVAEFADRRERWPASGAVGDVLAARLAQVDPLTPLCAALHGALDEHGQVQDGASPGLGELRRRLRVAEERIRRQLDQLLERLAPEGVLQDSFVTQRNGRHVIPVRRELRNRVAGVLHDHSDSGRTLFIEPAAAVALGNELADLRLEERDECRRVLARLSARVRESAAVLRADQARLAELDALGAVVAWAMATGAVLPRFGERLQVRQARHPLLLEQFRREGREGSLVPIDVVLPASVRVLLVSGPNSGGKTAALKTVGLLTLAAQAGLPVTAAAGSEFVAVEQVFADIGDEQSLLASLSTFTGHLTRVRSILQQVPVGRSLVILDEVGAGTDPHEGGALACAVLAALAGHGGLTLASTHLSAVKAFAHGREDMLSAAVRFNPATLQPEFALDLGTPGASQALTIAERVGMPADVLAEARRLLSGDVLRLERMLGSIEETQRDLARRERELAGTAAGLAGERASLQEELATLRRERRRLLHDAYRQAEGIVEHTRRDLERLLASCGRAPASPARGEAERAARGEIAERARRLHDAAANTAPRPLRPLAPAEIAVGQEVWVESLRGHARVVAVAAERQRVVVRAGGVAFEVDLGQVGRRESGAGEKAPAPLPEARPRSAGAVAAELLLIGKRVDEAIPVLDQYLDRALLAGLPEVRIVHGFGSGRLQEAVHDLLRGHPLVARFRLGSSGRDPGGAGATLVELRRG